MTDKNILPNKIQVKIMKDECGTFVAELPEYNLHTEADSVWELISNVNDAISLYFDVSDNSNMVIYTPQFQEKKEPTIKKFTPIDFFKCFPAQYCSGLN